MDNSITLWEIINETCSLRGISLSRGQIAIIRDAIIEAGFIRPPGDLTSN